MQIFSMRTKLYMAFHSVSRVYTTHFPNHYFNNFFVDKASLYEFCELLINLSNSVK